MIKGKACRNCHYIIEEGNECPNCHGKSFTTFWKGYSIIINPEKSEIAQKLNIKNPGKYALRLSR